MKENLTKKELFVEQNNKTNKTIPFEKGGIVGNKELEFIYTPKSYKSFIESDKTFEKFHNGRTTNHVKLNIQLSQEQKTFLTKIGKFLKK